VKIVELPANETTDWTWCEGERSAEHLHRLQHRVCRRLGCALGRCRGWSHDGKVAHLPLTLRWLGDWVDLGHNCSICVPATKVSASAVAQTWDLIGVRPWGRSSGRRSP